jgi:hypothetical protein
LVAYFALVVREKILLYDVEGILIARVLLFVGIVCSFVFPDSFAMWGVLMLVFILPVLLVYMRTQGGKNV